MKKINEIELNSLKKRSYLYNKGNSINDTEHGVWEIRGEDSNCDFGGHHSNPILGYAKGNFIDVLTYATTLNRFYTWGSGGYIVRYDNKEIVDVPSHFANDYFSGRYEEKEKLENEREELLKKLKETEESLSKYN